MCDPTTVVDRNGMILAGLRSGASYQDIMLGEPNVAFSEIVRAVHGSAEMKPREPRQIRQPTERTMRARVYHARAYFNWTIGEDEMLELLCRAGVPLRGLVRCMRRSPQALITHCSRCDLEITVEREILGEENC